MMTFAELKGDRIDDELASDDKTELFTTEKREAYLNEGQRVFNEHVGCYVQRLLLAVVDETQEYDVDAAATDYVRPSGTTASLQIVSASGTSYREGRELTVLAEETLNQRRPNWRAASPGVPECLYWRSEGGSRYLGFHPAPDIPVGETWMILVPYVAQPPDMTADEHEPFGAAAPLTLLRPYHRAVLHFAVAHLEKLRKNWEGYGRHMALFGLDPHTQVPTGAGFIAKYLREQAPKSGQGIRIAVNPRARGRMARPLDPRRYP